MPELKPPTCWKNKEQWQPFILLVTTQIVKILPVLPALAWQFYVQHQDETVATVQTKNANKNYFSVLKIHV